MPHNTSTLVYNTIPKHTAFYYYSHLPPGHADGYVLVSALSTPVQLQMLQTLKGY